MGDKEITKEERKNYICVSSTVSDIVNEVYLRLTRIRSTKRRRS